jgi:putative transcriptional regulator
MSATVKKGGKEQTPTDHIIRGEELNPDAPRSRRRGSVGSEILEALEEVRDAVESGEPLDRRFTVRSYRLDFAARDYGADEVRSVRQLLGLSQPLFANFLGVDASTVRSWEQGTRPPSTIARRFMDEVAINPEYWRGRLRESIAAVGPRPSTGN